MPKCGLAAVILGLVAAGLVVPSAVADSHGTDDTSRFIVTVVCTIYSDQLGEAMTGLELATGINLGKYMTDCDISTEYVEGELVSTTVVDIANGAGYPACQERNDCFDPHTITIDAGTEVVWTNNDVVLHTVTSVETYPDGTFDSWILPGEEFSFTFESPGTYEYSCTVHPWASGTVMVEQADAAMAQSTDAAMAQSTDAAMAQSTSEEYGPVQKLVDDFIELYMSEGLGALDIINDMRMEPSEPAVGTVINATDYMVLAHSSNPGYVGLNAQLILSKAYIPIETMMAMIMQEDGVWLSYPLPDVSGNIVGYERGWMKYHDGYVFMARHAVGVEELAQNIPGEMIRLYKMDPEGTFDTINSFMSASSYYPFVLDPDTTLVVAHGSDPDKVGGVSVVLTNSTVTLEEFRSIDEGEGVWTEYTFANPASGEEESKRSWIIKHDGYLFGAGYYP